MITPGRGGSPELARRQAWTKDNVSASSQARHHKVRAVASALTLLEEDAPETME